MSERNQRTAPTPSPRRGPAGGSLPAQAGRGDATPRPHVAWVRVSPAPGRSEAVASLNAIEGLGIEGDRHAQPDKRNQVLLIASETLDGFGLRPGDVRENIATRDLDEMALREGDRLHIGPAVELVVSHACAPCHKMNALQPGLQERLRGHRGMLAIVARGGVVTPGDPISVEAPAAG